MRTGWAAVRFGWMAYIVPILFVMSPALVMVGDPVTIVFVFATAVVGVWLVSIALAGFFLRALGPARRAAFLVAGVLALIPSNAFVGALYTDVAGFVLGLALLGYEYLTVRRTR